jgi:Domain of unknown function (DUF6538)
VFRTIFATLVGKREERISLGTRNPAEAKRLHALKLAEVEERWANLQNGKPPLSSDDVTQHAAAHDVCTERSKKIYEQPT